MLNARHGQCLPVPAGFRRNQGIAMSNTPTKRYAPSTSAQTWLNAAAVLFLVFGVIAGFAIGSTSFGGDFYSSQATWTGWAFFAGGVAGFVLFAGMGAVVGRLTDIRYLAALQVEDKLDALRAVDPVNAAQPSPSAR